MGYLCETCQVHDAETGYCDCHFSMFSAFSPGQHQCGTTELTPMRIPFHTISNSLLTNNHTVQQYTNLVTDNCSIKKNK